jgi:hypothetical protein
MVRRSTRSARGPKHCPITWQAWPHGDKWGAIPLRSHPKGSTTPDSNNRSPKTMGTIRFGTWKGGLWADFSFQTLATWSTAEHPTLWTCRGWDPMVQKHAVHQIYPNLPCLMGQLVCLPMTTGTCKFHYQDSTVSTIQYLGNYMGLGNFS